MALNEIIRNRFGNIREHTYEKAPRQAIHLAQSMESQAGKIPNRGYLGMAIGSMVVSAAVQIFGNTEDTKKIGNLIGLLSPTFLLIGIYNQIVEKPVSD